MYNIILFFAFLLSFAFCLCQQSTLSDKQFMKRMKVYLVKPNLTRETGAEWVSLPYPARFHYNIYCPDGYCFSLVDAFHDLYPIDKYEYKNKVYYHSTVTEEEIATWCHCLFHSSSTCLDPYKAIDIVIGDTTYSRKYTKYSRYSYPLNEFFFRKTVKYLKLEIMEGYKRCK